MIIFECLTENEDLSGRLRDLIAHVAEGAENQVIAILNTKRLAKTKNTAYHAATTLKAVMVEIDRDLTSHKDTFEMHLNDFKADLQKQVNSLAISDVANRTLMDMATSYITHILQVFDNSTANLNQISSIVEDLDKLNLETQSNTSVPYELKQANQVEFF